MRATLRSLAAAPGFFLIAVLTLALGIGLNATMFGVVNEILFRPAPYVRNPSTMVMICRAVEGAVCDNWAAEEVEEIRRAGPPVTGLAAARDAAVGFRAPGATTQRISATLVSPGFFRLLGVPVTIGRDFDPAQPASPAAIISPQFCREHFGNCEQVTGRHISLNGVDFTIIGVVPAGFHGTELGAQDSLWIPAGTATLIRDVPPAGREFHPYGLIARMNPDVAVAQLNAYLATLEPQLNRALPAHEPKLRIHAYPGLRIAPENLGEATGYAWLLFGVSALVLIVACANVANLVLARTTRRQHEIATRLALGATRWHLVRQFSLESLVLGIAAGGAGLLLNHWAARSLPWIQEPGFDFSPDITVYGFLAGISAAVVLVFGLLPAFHVSIGTVAEILKAAGPGSTSRSRVRDVLVMVQLALSVVLISGAAMGISILRRAADTKPGFRTSGLSVATIDLQMSGYNEVQGRGVHRRILEGIGGAVLARSLPISGETWFMALDIPGKVEPQKVLSNAVSPGYFQTLGIPVVAGRSFTASDGENGPLVAMVSQAMARRYWSGQSPVGRQFRLVTEDGRRFVPVTIVGVTADVHNVHLADRQDPVVYFPIAQQFVKQVVVLSPGTVPALLARLQSLDPALLPYRAETVDGVIAASLRDQRNSASLMAALGALATLLAGIGLYGLLSFTVAQRSRDYAIRIALGALNGDIRNLVIGYSLKLAALGLAAGAALSAALAKLLVSILYESEQVDFAALPIAVVLLGGVTLAAALLPAEKAIRSDPGKLLNQR